MKLSVVFVIVVAALALPREGGAQSRDTAAQARGKQSPPQIPASERPPAGMCRIWLDDVPAAQQPAPTDCPTAVRNRPAKGRVIFGDDYVTTKRDTGSSKGRPAIKGFAPTKSGSKKPPLRFP